MCRVYIWEELDCPSITLLLTSTVQSLNIYHVDMSMTSYVALINPLCNITRAYQLFVYNYCRVLVAMKEAIRATIVDDHLLISAFPFPFSVNFLRFTCTIKSVPSYISRVGPYKWTWSHSLSEIDHGGYTSVLIYELCSVCGRHRYTEPYSGCVDSVQPPARTQMWYKLHTSCTINKYSNFIQLSIIWV